MMGSRLRENVKHLFECFCEVAAPSIDKQPSIVRMYPEGYADQEILKSVPKFAYPCEFENMLVQHFSFVLTSIDSKWTFGFCRHDPKTDTALVVLSSLPWHEAFYKLLNHIATLTSSTNGVDLRKFLIDVYSCRVPIPGATITIPLPDPSTSFVCQSPRLFQLPSIPENRNLTEYYSAVDVQNMMIVFASMLYERRIIFTSKRLSRLSACVQACNALIYPMIWQHIYIPVLPLALTDYLLAPMPFLIGVPSPILRRVGRRDLGEVVILDADKNTIETPFHDLDSLPTDVVTNLKRALRNRPALLGDGVSRAFLRTLVQLTAGYREALTLQQGERITFDQRAFVENRPTSMQPFLRKMLELQIFQQFIDERLHMLNSGLGFSDEFEIEACNYSEKSGSKFMQQYREWTYAMRKEGSAFFRSVKDKANPAVRNAVKSVRDKGKDMKTVYKGLRWKGRSRVGENSMRFQQPRSAPSSPTLDRRPNTFASPSKGPSGFTASTSYRKDLRIRNSNISDTSRKQYSPLSQHSPEEPPELPPERLDIDLLHELQDVIFPANPPVDRSLKPFRRLDSFKPAWRRRARIGPLCPIVATSDYENFQNPSSSPSLRAPNIDPHDRPISELPIASTLSTKYITTPESSMTEPSTSYNTYEKPFVASPYAALLKSSVKVYIGDYLTDEEIREISECSEKANRIDNTRHSTRLQKNIERDDDAIEVLSSSFDASCIINDTSDGFDFRTVAFRSRKSKNTKSFDEQPDEARDFRTVAFGSRKSETTKSLDGQLDEARDFRTVAFDSRKSEVTKSLDGQLDEACGTSKIDIPSESEDSNPVPIDQNDSSNSSPIPAHFFVEVRIAQNKNSVPVQQDLIRLDSANSDDDFDPLLWSTSSKYGNAKQMTQSLHIPQSGEGLSNPLYPYFLPSQSSAVQRRCGPYEAVRDCDLLQEYGLDFNKFGLANGASSSTQNTSCDRTSQSVTGNADDPFGESFAPSATKSQKNWTKFE